MKAVVLAAGLGTRLGALSDSTAKPALDVAGKPIVVHVVENLARCGFRELAINLHHRPDDVREALGDGSALGVGVTYFPEEELLGTAGTLRALAGFLADAEDFLVHYGDVVTEHDVGSMLATHHRRRALLTLLVHERPGSNSIVTVDDHWRVVEFLERPGAEERRGRASTWVNSGIYACSREVLELVPETPPRDIARDVVPRAVATGRTFAEPLAGRRWAIDSVERLEEARRVLGGRAID